MTQVVTDLAKASPPQPAKSNRICRHFVRGRCTWGLACRFSHDAERAEEASSSNTPKAQSPTGMLNNSWIGAQQTSLQQQRHAILKAAIDGQFAVRPQIGSDGQTHHLIHLTALPSPEIAIQLLSKQQLKTQLIALEKDERVREGGLHYLIGEPSVFWSMIRNFHQTGSTMSPKWDAHLQRAAIGKVECMFFRSSVGCLGANCPFDHVPKPASIATGTPVLTLATSNALLGRVPSLGFGTSLSSGDKLDSLPISFPTALSSDLLYSPGSLTASTPPAATDPWSTKVSSETVKNEDDLLMKGIWGVISGDSQQPSAQGHGIW